MNKSRIQNIVLATISILVTLLILNAVFNRTNLKETETDRNKNISLNDSINRANKNFALNNPHGFTDVPRNKKKQPGTYRIAVLGDSFIWGDGLPYEKVWSHKLEKMLLEKYDSIEVMHWGINGWSTKNQLMFLDTAGMQYDFDLLILGWVNNDPDMGDYTHMNYNYNITFRLFYKIFPSLAEKVLGNMFRISYQNWINKLYSEKNLLKYELVLDSLRMKATSKGADFFCVLTPSCIGAHCHAEYVKIKPLIKKLNIDMIDVYDACESKFSGYPPEALMANPENHHPGDLMTKVFAEEVLKHLEQHYAQKLKSKQQYLIKHAE